MDVSSAVSIYEERKDYLMDDQDSDKFIKSSRVVSALGIILVVVSGWFFTVVVSGQQGMKRRQELMGERLARVEVRIELIKEFIDDKRRNNGR